MAGGSAWTTTRTGRGRGKEKAGEDNRERFAAELAEARKPVLLRLRVAARGPGHQGDLMTVLAMWG